MATASPQRRTRAKPVARKKAAKKPTKRTAKKTAKKPAKRTVKKTTKRAAKKTTKRAAKKTAARKTATTKSARYPFPFFGAGLASYFEWGGLYVWFVDPPPRSARAKLMKAIPEPFRGDAGWGGPVLHATSGDQFINLHICSAYARLGDPSDSDLTPEDEGYFDEIEGFGVGEPFPNRKQARAFEADLVKWLTALHRKHPIAFVARREDSEAGGTRLDAWHRWSMTRFVDVVLPLWRAHHRKPAHELVDWSLREALGLALDDPTLQKNKAAIPADVRAWFAKD